MMGRTVLVSRGSAGTPRPTVHPRPASRYRWVIALVGLSLLLAGCGNMKKQRYARPDTPAAQLPRGTSAQLPPSHVVPFAAGSSSAPSNAGGVPQIPVKVTKPLLERGRERFTIYCAVCHGPDGYGRGIVVRRGFPAPPSFHDERLRNVPTGYFFQVMTNGHGLMYSYADRVAAADRWAIAAYIRALQLSQHADVQRVSATDRQRLSER